MGFFEYLFESRNPGKVGSIEENKQSLKHVSILVLIIKLFVSMLIIYVLLSITVMQNLNFMNIIIFIIILFSYCYLSYKFIPHPDNSNVGLLGGLIDHPFKYTDDLNRMLIVFFVLMYPGRFITTTVLQTLRLFKRSN